MVNIPEATELDQYVCDLSTAVWEQTLGLPLEPVAAIPPRDGQTIEGHVNITGEWNGVVVVQCSMDAARRAMDVVFGQIAEDEGPVDVHDAVGELTNMIGGNLKALISDSGCYLSLPLVIEGSDYTVRMPGARVIASRAFLSDHEPVVVTLLEPLKKPQRSH